MKRGLLADPDFKGQFSGHETFPLRYGWLNKVYEAASIGRAKKGKPLFSTEEAMIIFGVGKNMVASMKYWALATDIIEADQRGSLRATEFADMLLGPNGHDPYLEHPASLWLLHWKLAATPIKTTTWYWAFNHMSGQTIDRDMLSGAIHEYCLERRWGRVSANTVRRDVDCFIGTYVADSRAVFDSFSEVTLESPLAELGLIVPAGRRGVFQFQRGPKASLPDGVFAYALADFWQRQTTVASLSVEAITYEPGSPGRVFKLDEESVTERLARIDVASANAFRWTDTAGMRQVIKVKPVTDPIKFIASAYRTDSRSRRAV